MSYTVTKLVSVMTSFLGLVFWLLQILVVLNYNIFKSESSSWLDYIWCWHMRAPRARSYNIAHEHVGVLLNLTSTTLLLIVRLSNRHHRPIKTSSKRSKRCDQEKSDYSETNDKRAYHLRIAMFENSGKIYNNFCAIFSRMIWSVNQIVINGFLSDFVVITSSVYGVYRLKQLFFSISVNSGFRNIYLNFKE